MERAEYEQMHAVEDRMWWYRGLRTLAAGQLARALSSAPAGGPVLDAGCGTGGMLRVLGPAVAGRPERTDQAMSNRSRFMTLSHAAAKSRTNFSRASSHA